MDIVIALIQYYSFDLGDYSIDDLVKLWCEYDPIWLRLAIIEALFRGRYKAVSVDQILSFWQRRGEPYCRFSHEFERLVCADFVSLPSVPRKVTYTSYKAPSVSNSQTNSMIKRPEKSCYSVQRQALKPLSSNYQSAMQQMNLLADTSLFVDKLKSMCKDSSDISKEPNTANEPNLIAQLTAYSDI
jgi:hypothetical protein